MKRILFSILTAASLAGSAFAGTAHAAGNAAFYLAPASGSHFQNSSFTVQVRENGSDVNVVTAKLTYDASKLTCNGVSNAFGSTISATCGGGSITISGYAAPGTTVSGDQAVGSISFTALAGSGSTSVSFAGGSQIASNGQNVWNGNTAGGTYTFTTPVTPTPTPVTPNPSPRTTPSSSPSPSNAVANTSTAKPATGSTGTASGTVASAATTDSNAPAATNSPTAADDKKTDGPAVKNHADTTAKAAQKSSKAGWAWAGLLAAIAAVAYYVFATRNSRATTATPADMKDKSDTKRPVGKK